MNVLLSALLLVFIACSGTEDTPKPEIISLLGTPLYTPAGNDSLLKVIEAELEKQPDNLDLLFSKGRALSEMMRVNDAIAVYKRCTELAPDHPVFFRRLGHRYISARRFDEALKALEKAAELNKDFWPADKLEEQSWGAYNWRHEFDIRYHFGLAYYLKHDFTNAAKQYRLCLEAARDDNAKIAAINWLYFSLSRDGKNDEAAELLDMVTPDMEVTSNFTYHNLMLFAKGVINEDELLNQDRYGRLETVAYGLAAHYLTIGELEGANEILEMIVQESHWTGFGFIAAEAELAAQRKQ